jgi:hypothetical protein
MTQRLTGDDIQVDALAKTLATHSEEFALRGGYYDFSAQCGTWGDPAGKVQVEQLMPDGATYVGVGDGLGADGTEQVYLPSGSYRFAVTSALGATAAVRLARIPLGN